MKIWEIVTEDLQAGAGGVTVGNAGSETMMMRPPERVRHLKPIPQVGYGIKIGNRVIPTPKYTDDNDRGQINKIEGG
jgi:hypothetical protein